MTKYYRDYFWNEGIPYGIIPLDEKDSSSEECYKIVMDPYRKRISIEKYVSQQFITTIYDSAFLNFRRLNQTEQQAWQKLIVKETDEQIECIIRDQDDRVLFFETYTFQNDYCKQCLVTSPQGLLLSVQKMFYKILGDIENVVILFDTNNHPVIKKIYDADPLTGEFTTLREEIRDMQKETPRTKGP